jgi:hypothetical protein
MEPIELNEAWEYLQPGHGSRARHWQKLVREPGQINLVKGQRADGFCVKGLADHDEPAVGDIVIARRWSTNASGSQRGGEHGLFIVDSVTIVALEPQATVTMIATATTIGPLLRKALRIFQSYPHPDVRAFAVLNDLDQAQADAA